MYQSPRLISKKHLPVLRKDLEIFLRDNDSIYARFIKRKVFFDELPDSIIKRKDASRRLRAFGVAMDILKKSDAFTQRIGKGGVVEFEVVGLSGCNQEVKIHIRQVADAKKNKKLQFISCFSSKDSL